MKLAARTLGACLAGALLMVSSPADRRVSAQPQSDSSGERILAGRGVAETTAAIMAREDDPGGSPRGNHLTIGAGSAFTAIRFSDTSTLPPDGSAAAGSTQFIAIANGRVRSFLKS